ncbi:MAG: AAA family ATPase, partial [Desulfobacterales bacterium]|nr:AAA family ATPase [Desulfobacterales bacterium]
MKLLSLELLAFGPFTGTILDLSDGDAGVHLIHGPNEAGKSAALRGLTNFFYGIPPRTADNFIHANPDLRIGAEILHSDGQSALHVIRRKGNKNTLLDPSGNPLADDALAKYLGEVTRELFTTMYGIDQEILVRGGKALVEGGGDLGESLFAAGLGVAGMKDVMTLLEAEAGGLFKPNARNPLINSLISAFKDARKQCAGKSLSPAEWDRHDRSLRRAEKEKREVEKTLGGLLSERNRFERLQKAIPRIVAMRGLRAELETMGDAPILPPDFPGERRTARETLNRARTARERLEKELAIIKASMSKISPSEHLVKAQDDINNLFQRSGSHKKAQLDLPRRRADYYRLREEAEAILKQMGPGFTLDNAEALRLTDARIARIQKLGRELDPLLERIRAREKEKANLEADLAAARKELAGMPMEMDAGRLEEACARARRQGDLASRLQKTVGDLKKRRKRAENGLARLGLWKGPLEKVETLAAPAQETVDRFEADFQSAASRMERIAEDVSEQRDRITGLNGRIEELKAGGSVPAEEDLTAARQRRDQGWRLIRGAWLQGRSDSEGVRSFIPAAGEAAGPEALADEYVKSVARADEVGDRLRHESERVARLAEFTARKRECEKRLEARERERAAVREHRKALGERWSAVWADMGIAPLSPREMGAWLQKLQNVREAVVDLRERTVEKDEIQAVIEALRSDVSDGLKELGESPAGSGEKLESLIHRAESRVKSAREAARARESLLKAIHDLERGRNLAHMDLEQAGEARKSWLVKWGEAMRPLGLDKDSLPEEADAVLTRTRQLFERVDQSRVMRGRIRAMEADAKKFEEEVARLCVRLAPDQAELSPEEAVS